MQRKGQGDERIVKTTSLLFGTMEELQNVVQKYRAELIKFMADIVIDEYAEFSEQEGEAKIGINTLYRDVEIEIASRSERIEPQPSEGRNCALM